MRVIQPLAVIEQGLLGCAVARHGVLPGQGQVPTFPGRGHSNPVAPVCRDQMPPNAAIAAAFTAYRAENGSPLAANARFNRRMHSRENLDIWRADDWPRWRYDLSALAGLLTEVSRAQGMFPCTWSSVRWDGGRCISRHRQPPHCRSKRRVFWRGRTKPPASPCSSRRHWLTCGSSPCTFDDGNGRLARAVGDLFLARADGSPQRFYSCRRRSSVSATTTTTSWSARRKAPLMSPAGCRGFSLRSGAPSPARTPRWMPCWPRRASGNAGRARR